MPSVFPGIRQTPVDQLCRSGHSVPDQKSVGLPPPPYSVPRTSPPTFQALQLATDETPHSALRPAELVNYDVCLRLALERQRNVNRAAFVEPRRALVGN